MTEGLIPRLARPEKELAVLEIVKNAEREKRPLDITLTGTVDPWVREWIGRRGHTLGGSGRDLAIYVDSRLGRTQLERARSAHRMVALVYPSAAAAGLPKALSSGIPDAALSGETVRGADVKDIFYGLWNIAYFGFKEPEHSGAYFFAVFCLLAFIVLFVFPHDPADDLLRHSKAYLYGYDYSKLYVYAWNYPVDPYITFDMFAGWMDANFGYMGLKLIQGLCLLAFCVGFYLNTRRWSDRFRILAFGLVLLSIGGRITLGRPEAFEAAFLLIGLALSGLPAVAWGSLMGALYFLFPIYLVPLAIVKREYAASIIVALAFWYAMIGPAFVSDAYQVVSSVLFNRAYPIVENLSVLNLLGSAAFLILLYLFIKSRDFRYALPIILFALINQLRYVDVLAPLIAISLSERKAGLEAVRFGPLETAAFLAVMFVSLQYAFPDYRIQDISISNSSVLCDSTLCMYNVVYTGRNITISPSMELGFSDKALQDASASMIYNGTLDCSIFARYRFDKVVESSLTEIPPCLKLDSVAGAYRIWDVDQAAVSRSGS